MSASATRKYFIGRTWHISFRFEKKGDPYTPEGWADRRYCLHMGDSENETAKPSVDIKLTKGTETEDGKEYKILTGRVEKSKTAELTRGRYYRHITSVDDTEDPDWFEVLYDDYKTVFNAPDTEPCNE